MNLARALFDRDFWMCGLAMARYVPRALRIAPLDGSLFFTQAKLTEFQTRIANLRSDAPRQWGTMDVAQMLHHLNLACGGSLGFYEVPDESYLISRTVFRWILVDWFSEQPLGLRLPAGFKLSLDKHFDFDTEKAQLLTILEADYRARSAEAWKPHPMFGKMTVREWGKLLTMHIDYHLRQFSA